MRQSVLSLVALFLTTANSLAASVSGQGTWETTLQGRLPVTPGETDYQAYYDTDLNVTWVADANLAATLGYSIAGLMDWATARAFVDSLNGYGYLGADNWRLPALTDTGDPGCVFGWAGTDCGWNVDTSYSEMAHMFYDTLGNNALADPTGNVGFGCSPFAPRCLNNEGPFRDIQTEVGHFYWSGTEYAPDTSRAWGFNFYVGGQGDGSKANFNWAWVVRDGDISPVPIPPAAWLVAPGLGMLVPWVRRRKVTTSPVCA